MIRARERNTAMKKKSGMKHLARYLCLLMIFSTILTMPAFAAKKRVLVAYFSATGNTKAAAKKVKMASGGTLYRIRPQKAYTKADLNYNNSNSRATKEQSDESVRPAIKGKVRNIRKYDTIFIGYPIWWGREPKVIRTFLESYNLKGKTIIPFCTSGSSGISGSMKWIRESAAGARVKKGKDLTDMSYEQVKKWVSRMM